MRPVIKQRASWTTAKARVLGSSLNHRDSGMRRCWFRYSLALLLILSVVKTPWTSAEEDFILGSGAPVPVISVAIRDRHSEELDEQLADKIKFVVLAREPEIATFVSQGVHRVWLSLFWGFVKIFLFGVCGAHALGLACRLCGYFVSAYVCMYVCTGVCLQLVSNHFLLACLHICFFVRSPRPAICWRKTLGCTAARNSRSPRW